MSGWDQKYDLQDWARDVQEQAESLQRTNKACRYIYLAGAVVSLLFGIVFQFVLSIFVGGFFVALALYNERMIWKLKKAGIK